MGKRLPIRVDDVLAVSEDVVDGVVGALVARGVSWEDAGEFAELVRQKVEELLEYAE